MEHLIRLAQLIDTPSIGSNTAAGLFSKQGTPPFLRSRSLAIFFARSPINLSESVNDTIDGVVLFPCSLEIISTFPFYHKPTQE